jgi:hypothetical protein
VAQRVQAKASLFLGRSYLSDGIRQINRANTSIDGVRADMAPKRKNCTFVMSALLGAFCRNADRLPQGPCKILKFDYDSDGLEARLGRG